jgi:hypothetical protein
VTNAKVSFSGTFCIQRNNAFQALKKKKHPQKASKQKPTQFLKRALCFT